MNLAQNCFPVYSQQNQGKMKVETIIERLLDICFHAFLVVHLDRIFPTRNSSFQIAANQTFP